MGRQIKWGVLGYARIAKMWVIPAILQSANSELYAVASSDPSKQKECKELFPCERVYSTYMELLEDPQIQAIYIPLPNSMHREWAIKAMQKGKHVLCEKPIALTASECLEMIQTAEEHNVLLMEAFMYRFTDRMQKVNEILDSGILGDVKYIQSTFRFLLNRPNTIKMKPQLGGGSLYDVGCYPINFVGMITKQIPESVVTKYIKQDSVDVMFSAVLKYADGVLATINCGFNAFDQMHSEIVGTKGRLEIPETFLGNPGAIQLVTETERRQIGVDESDRYALEITHFSESILQQRKPFLSLQESYQNMQVLDLLHETVK